MKNKDLKLKGLSGSLKQVFSKINAYKVFIFFLLVAATYGYILWRINVFSNAPADPAQEAAQKSAQPHIDAATVEKIQSLQDNSVSVQSLFDSARQNTFNE
jgi:zona occludens toxin (predicted ATPase)